MALSKEQDAERRGVAADEAEIEIPEDRRFRVMRRLVNALLVTLIAGVITIVAAVLIKLKSTSLAPVAGLAPTETIASATATAERLTLVLRDRESGAERVVVLDAKTYRPIASIDGN